MQSVTRMIEDEVYETVTESGIPVTIDMRPAPRKANQSPVELLQSALSACAAVDVVAILRKRKKTIIAFTIDSKGERRQDPPRYFTHLSLKFCVVSPDVTEDELEKAAALSLEKYCSVAASLKAEVTFTVEVKRSVKE